MICLESSDWIIFLLDKGIKSSILLLALQKNNAINTGFGE
ncbi:hypothetical protein NCCP28_04620 [Niallia sp. NCCP-28]|nr:hypothetical protein NCCP28_04620 [Niallia sp. NCCP-28]